MNVTMTKQSFRVLSLLIFVGLLSFAGMSMMREGNPVQASPSDGASVKLVPAGDVRVGEVIQLELIATNVRNLAGFQATLKLKSDQLRLTGAAIEEDLTRSGRDILPLGPVLLSDTVILGAATCPVEDCNQSVFDPTLQASAGVEGNVTLATIELHANQAGSYTLSLDEVQLIDPEGQVLDVMVTEKLLVVEKE